MKKALKILSVSALLFVALNAKDFSKTSDEDLAKMAGVVAPQDIVDYTKELKMRMKKMSEDKRKAFHKQLHEYAIKNTDSMTVADFEARQKAVKEALKKGNMEDMDDDFGLRSCKHGKKHKHDKHGKKHGKKHDKDHDDKDHDHHDEDHSDKH
ncbi:zinc ABC transporter substrate-binding protein [Helicobacter pylori]|uniref:sialic acid-binding protein n=1 Tax=Helicobacter pylori TaxID=210 RepID=UPI000991A643|nr:sialic acid-binding protein [Helicobacter pylori]OOQ31772.1 zinc ABC transporter substrate-binding protein [Helicobacter pylori]PDW18583.1 zinc ABC transporter substrate-binding protein [Helicobacter pylori]PDW58808.1 zinc ABC transporter substrate-binding protein [Helicobacter pylori]PDW69032.1 zinc ABC transporter substrate-binding protein [Helicobacter pylori]PDW94338.1 zinc ABC transporter substrate-binding protein [Helicobacter pylori]